MKSIRFYLIATILAAMTLLIFLSALQGYHKSSKEAKDLLDKQLVDMAHVLSTLPVESEDNNSIVTGIETSSIAFQIWKDQQLISRSNNAPEQPMTGLTIGFHDSNFAQYRWRNYVHHNTSTQRWVITAERTDIRNHLTDNLIIGSALPIVSMLPIALLIIWFFVGSGLKPVSQLSTQLQQKQINDLSPVALPTPVKELQPLVQSINSLLSRLRNAFDREKNFSADAAHELRTPVSGLKVNLYNLKNELPQNPDLDRLISGVDRMGHIINQIIALYRSTPDQYSADFEVLDLHEITQYCIAQQYPDFEKKNQLIELSGNSARIKGDRFTLETLLQNLLSNASKYTPDNGCIEVSVCRHNDCLQLKIEDSGPGVEEDKHQRIFDRFYRLHGDKHSSGIEGCGLGLSIVQHIVQLHGGSIELSHSRFPTGLAVTISFPATGNQ